MVDIISSLKWSTDDVHNGRLTTLIYAYGQKWTNVYIWHIYCILYGRKCAFGFSHFRLSVSLVNILGFSLKVYIAPLLAPSYVLKSTLMMGLCKGHLTCLLYLDLFSFEYLKMGSFHNPTFIMCHAAAATVPERQYCKQSQAVAVCIWAAVTVSSLPHLNTSSGCSMWRRRSCVGLVWRTLQTSESLCLVICETHPWVKHICWSVSCTPTPPQHSEKGSCFFPCGVVAFLLCGSLKKMVNIQRKIPLLTPPLQCFKQEQQSSQSDMGSHWKVETGGSRCYPLTQIMERCMANGSRSIVTVEGKKRMWLINSGQHLHLFCDCPVTAHSADVLFDRAKDRKSFVTPITPA